MNAVMAGHVHAYERSRPVVEGRAPVTDGIVYFNIGVREAGMLVLLLAKGMVLVKRRLSWWWCGGGGAVRMRATGRDTPASTTTP